MKIRRKIKRYIRKESWVSCFLVAIIMILCLLPVWTAVVASFSDEKDIVQYGFELWPRTFTTATYEFIFSEKGKMLIRAYLVSFLTVICGTAYSMFIMITYAYATAQKKEVFPYAKILSFFAWFTMVFSGGVLPWYILCTRYYGLRNNLFALFIPYGMNVFNMFILQNNFKALQGEIMEAAKIDGASDFKAFIMIALPLSKVSLVTVILFCALLYWNDYHLSLYLITTQKLYTVQKLLYNMMANIQALLSGANLASMHMTVPSNTAKMVMMVLTAAPVMCFYPFAQKYFIKGITVGAIKG